MHQYSHTRAENSSKIVHQSQVVLNYFYFLFFQRKNDSVRTPQVLQWVFFSENVFCLEMVIEMNEKWTSPAK